MGGYFLGCFERLLVLCFEHMYCFTFCSSFGSMSLFALGFRRSTLPAAASASAGGWLRCSCGATFACKQGFGKHLVSCVWDGRRSAVCELAPAAPGPRRAGQPKRHRRKNEDVSGHLLDAAKLQRQGYTQESAARQVGISPSMLSRYKRGQAVPTSKRLGKHARGVAPQAVDSHGLRADCRWLGRPRRRARGHAGLQSSRPMASVEG